MTAKTKPADPAETAPAPEAADDQPAPDLPMRGIDREALKRLDPEIEAMRRAAAERTAAAAARAKPAAAPKPQPETAADPLAEIQDPALRRALASLQTHIEASPRPATPPPPPPPPEKKGQLILFPQWAEDRRAAVHAVFRSALFPALNFKEGRPFLKEKRIASVEGVTVFFTGEQFDQSDLDVYLELLQFAHETPFGMECTFSAYSLLKALNRAKGNKDHKRLHSELTRLRSGTVDMTDHGIRYFGGLIEGGIKDEITKHYNIRINPDFARFFKSGLWASLDKEQRRALGRDQTAKALHAYYSTHAAPGLHTYEKLAAIIGLQNKTSRNLRANIIKAHEAMKRIGFMSDYEAGPKTITAKINHTPGQAHHLVKKIIKGRKAKKGTG